MADNQHQGHGHGHGHGGQMTPEQQKQMIEQEIKLARNLGQIKYKIAVMSGKGGVGKSTVAANLAETFQKLGFSTGILDADIHGPNIPKMLGLEGADLFINENRNMVPVEAPSGLKVMSMAFMLESIDTPIIWRGPQKSGSIKQLIAEVEWGPLDVLIIDNPPGTGDEPLTVLQTIPNTDAVIMVTTPNVVSQEDVLKCVKMVNMLNVENIGLIENMAYYICPHCGEKLAIFGEGDGEAFSEEMEIEYLGDLPLTEKVSDSPNQDGVVSTIDPDGEVSKRFEDIVGKIKEEFLKEE
ncbi:MAG: Mrp/NBP35 family ATP-binding protein [Methanobrevibacter sp.]|uniref:Iron-sulfur cluster carrier protein n=1 Tax=Methanobrevibacter millerae TaxID=230361 RepID=A0A8T3VIJ9_9EURY|nr:Mrp/NBP35 family ATP-binding protein [Methanobrevibacter millerae]MBE6504510.1 Mrp/NBP35 family ATP-binding protein [Methanobrevibacter millerae]MBR0058720.1 Mrp/NBP35 family ATP-binding protein [Methanobrevibacter sp.]MBR0371222.1 Mrp/NBP35 family ATP-binding protein [Methanobrevibacter sp.]